MALGYMVGTICPETTTGRPKPWCRDEICMPEIDDYEPFICLKQEYILSLQIPGRIQLGSQTGSESPHPPVGDVENMQLIDCMEHGFDQSTQLILVVLLLRKSTD